MKKRIKYIFLSLLFISILIYRIIDINNNNDVSAQNNKYRLNIADSRCNSIKYLHNILSIEDSSTGKSKVSTVDNMKFTSEKVVDKKNWQIKSLSMENDDIILETDEYSNIITYANKKLMNKQKEKEYKKIPIDKLENTAKKVFDALGIHDLEYSGSREILNGCVIFSWTRTYDGYSFETDFLLISMCDQTGEIVGISNRLLSVVPIINVKLSEEDAKKIANDYLKKKVSFDIEEPLSIQKMIINPNDYWISVKPNLTYNSNSRLSYEIKYAKDDLSTKVAVIWIDCENGDILGGYASN